MRNRRLRALAGMAALTLAGAGLAGCTAVAPPDQIGLYYYQGSVEGNRFDHCFLPGQTDAEPINDYVVWLPTNTRYWRYALDDKADVKAGIKVAGLPRKGETTGKNVDVFSQTALNLNTNCGKDEKAADSPLVQYWERTGRRFGAGWGGENSTDEGRNLKGEPGWDAMMVALVDVSLQAAIRDVAGKYDPDAMVGNAPGVRASMQAEIGRRFQENLNRAAGGPDYFCGPTFPRGKHAPWPEIADDGVTKIKKEGPCPPVEVTITNITGDPAVQAATNEKFAARERATAALIGAQSLLDVRDKLATALGDPNFVRYLLEQERTKQIQLAEQERTKQAEICAEKPGCVVRVGPGVDADRTP